MGQPGGGRQIADAQIAGDPSAGPRHGKAPPPPRRAGPRFRRATIARIGLGRADGSVARGLADGRVLREMVGSAAARAAARRAIHGGESPLSAEPTTPSPQADARPGQDKGPRSRTAPAVAVAFTALKIVIVIGIASLLVASAMLLAFGAIETGRHAVRLVLPGVSAMSNREMFLASIKLVDLILLSTIMQVVAIGLYCLFIDQDIPVPAWLRTAQVDELKAKLAGIVAVMLGVLFLEQVIEGNSEILPLGIAVALVIAALTWFIRAHPH
jgi:uncharacterized membrane protein YqhA